MIDKVIPASREHIPFIVQAARQADMDECWAAGALPLSDALEMSLIDVDYARTWVVNDFPAAIGGVRSNPYEEGQGIIWVLGTDLIEMYPRRFLVRALVEFDRVKKDFTSLYNYIDARNTRFIRWLKWMGFEFSEPIPHGCFGKLFYRFEWRINDSSN